MSNTQLQFSISRTHRFLNEIVSLKQLEFPYNHSEQALDILEAQFNEQLARLKIITPQTPLVTSNNLCSQVLQKIKLNLPLLGFIHRSTSVRNTFEIHGPLFRMACQLLEPNTPTYLDPIKLVLSSEWDYSPFTYLHARSIPGFVFIGSPAHESSNPLITPLAGHELGHSIWAKQVLGKTLEGVLKTALSQAIQSRWSEYIRVFSLTELSLKESTFDLIRLDLVHTWSKPLKWLTKQAEESFCDLIGLRLFGESYMFAFAYLIAPSFDSKRSPVYPNLKNRIEQLTKVAESWNIKCPVDFIDFFSDFSEPDYQIQEKFQLTIADEALKIALPDIVAKADTVIAKSGIHLPSETEAEFIVNRFEKGVPAESVKCLADIINAGWVQYNAAMNDQNIHTDDHALADLVLKTIEILDIDQILVEREQSEKLNEEYANFRTDIVAEPKTQKVGQISLFDSENG